MTATRGCRIDLLEKIILSQVSMQKFIVTIAGDGFTAREIEQAIYNAFTEMGKDDIIVTETL